MDNFFGLVTDYGYPAIFALLVLGIVGLPIPDETMLAFAGYLVFKEKLSFLPTFGAAFLGTTCGITFSYLIGRTLGFRLLHKYGPKVFLTTEKIDRVHAWFLRGGKWCLPFGYFVPGIRHLTALVAGAAKLDGSVFCLFAYSGGFCWSLLFVSLGYFLGEGWNLISEEFRRHILMIIGLLAVCAGVLILAHQAHRRRRAEK